MPRVTPGTPMSWKSAMQIGSDRQIAELRAKIKQFEGAIRRIEPDPPSGLAQIEARFRQRIESLLEQVRELKIPRLD